MKLNVFVDKTKEEKIDIYIHEKRKIVDDIERLLSCENELLGFINGEIYKLYFSDIVLFSVENEKIKAFTNNEEFTVKERLYMIEEKMPDYFIKLNQSAIGNLRAIKKFDCSVSGTLKVTFNNGLTDFVSRRQVKAVKERLGL
ncbi:MAG: LytTR family transcriptional regulator [Clostridia bacterium]|nr:LytTR family transcriptional regulator [Clostridia bacterium]